MTARVRSFARSIDRIATHTAAQVYLSIEAFAFIGNAAFSHQAGQLRFESAGGQTAIYADVDGDGYADMQIVLQSINDAKELIGTVMEELRKKKEES